MDHLLLMCRFDAALSLTSIVMLTLALVVVNSTNTADLPNTTLSCCSQQRVTMLPSVLSP